MYIYINLSLSGIFITNSAALWFRTRKSQRRLAQGICHWGWCWDSGALWEDDAALWSHALGRRGGRQGVSVPDICFFLFLAKVWDVHGSNNLPQCEHTCNDCLCLLRLVFSQSLISLDLIEDFLELSCRAKDEGKISPYKGRFKVKL